MITDLVGKKIVVTASASFAHTKRTRGTATIFPTKNSTIAGSSSNVQTFEILNGTTLKVKKITYKPKRTLVKVSVPKKDNKLYRTASFSIPLKEFEALQYTIKEDNES